MMRTPFSGSRHRRAQGIAAVEVAVALPLLALVLVAIAEGGRVMSEATLLTRAVQLGARYAADNATVGSTGVVTLSDTLILTTQNLVVSGSVAGGAAVLPGFSKATVTLTSPASNAVEVGAQYVYRPIFHAGIPALSGGGSGIGITLSAHTRVQVLP